MAAQVRWNGDRFEREFKLKMGQRISAAAILVLNHAKTIISEEGTGVDEKGNLIYGANPSSPGEPPHTQTGRLRGSVAFEVVGLIARIGTNVKYGRWLELGTSKMAARPWLRRASLEQKSKVETLLSRRMF